MTSRSPSPVNPGLAFLRARLRQGPNDTPNVPSRAPHDLSSDGILNPLDDEDDNMAGEVIDDQLLDKSSGSQNGLDEMIRIIKKKGHFTAESASQLDIFGVIFIHSQTAVTIILH